MLRSWLDQWSCTGTTTSSSRTPPRSSSSWLLPGRWDPGRVVFLATALQLVDCVLASIAMRWLSKIYDSIAHGSFKNVHFWGPLLWVRAHGYPWQESCVAGVYVLHALFTRQSRSIRRVCTIGQAFEHAPGGKTHTKKVSRTSVASHPLRAAGRTLFALFP